MNTPTQQNRSSASDAGMMSSATLSATALATACCAGPNICTACFAPLIVTLLNRTVAGLVSRFGATTLGSSIRHRASGAMIEPELYLDAALILSAVNRKSVLACGLWHSKQLFRLA